MSGRAAVLGLVLWSGAAALSGAQSIAARVAAAPDGDVRLSYTARPGVLGNGRNTIQWNCRHGHCQSQVDGDWSDGDDWRNVCDSGPVRVALRIRGGAVTDVRVAVGGVWIPRDHVTDLGTVAAPAAARYLVALAADADAGKVGGRAIFAATLADSAVVWPELLRMARSPRLPRETRHQAVFWISQAAEDAATSGLDSLVETDSVDRDVREQAVFAISQRPSDEGVPILIRVAKTHRDPEVRRRAIFWLGQSDDPRALSLFEDLLTKP
jgi:hypothetical protein